jgi:predicted MFS family arabinose efflux permease
MAGTRVAVAWIFFANGAGMASWVPHIPMVQATLGLGPSVLGLALLAMGVGALVGIPLSGRASARFGSRTVVRTTALLFFAALPLPLLAPTLAHLVVALFVLGAGNGALDVSMNAQAAAVERRWPRPIMSSFHAMWSAGGIAGAGTAALALGAGIEPARHLSVAAVVLLATTLPALLPLLPPAADTHGDDRRLARPTRAVLGLGLVAFLALLAEGAVGDWSAVYLRHDLGTSDATAALGYAAFSLTMAVGRFLGDALVARLGDERVVRRFTGGAALGLGAALAIGHPWAALVGFATAGFGIANLIPIVFRAASRLRGVPPSEGIAAVGTFGYVGFLTGPPLIGLVAELLTLPVALGLVVAALAWIANAAPEVRVTTDPAVVDELQRNRAQTK